MKQPIPVTPIFPRNGASPPQKLPIRNTEHRDGMIRMLRSEVHSDMNTSPIHTPISSASISPQQISCITIAQHIDTCPICSRFYDTDKTLYILAIIGLLVLCFLLVKRILNL
jgi:hypothetical protein